MAIPRYNSGWPARCKANIAMSLVRSRLKCGEPQQAGTPASAPVLIQMDVKSYGRFL